MSIRLINTQNLRMRVFTGDSTPKYAILSHTWVEDEEVSCQEMLRIASDPDHPAMQKSGYTKIVKTCQKAKSHNLDWAWVDTCCIDKTSSAELSEAINSMFKWYEKSQVCYVFLADMDPDSEVEEGLADCKWFTRGWCLQELLAPNNLMFYNAAWENIGSKSRLKRFISEVTYIDEEVLTDSTLLYTYPVARKMSWAATRETTRVEDLAYSLLGIFDVNMPMLYGEGNKAFFRLQEEIIKKSSDLSIFAFSSVTQALEEEDSSISGSSSGSHSSTGYGYCNLFANSPSDFIDCGELTNINKEIVVKQPFTLTNNGLYFTAAEFLVGMGYHDYTMALNCTHTKIYNPLRLYLRKVGPGVFAKLESPSDGDQNWNPGEAYNNYRDTEEAYIITKITPSIESLVDPLKIRFMQVACDNVPDFRDGIQTAWPRDRWDIANLKFLTGGQRSFEGYLKIFPSLIGLEHMEIKGSEYFCLVCGIDWHDMKWVGGRGDGPVLEKPRPWLAIYSATAWENLERIHGKMTIRVAERYFVSGKTQAKVILGEMTVNAEVHPVPNAKSSFRINLSMRLTENSSNQTIREIVGRRLKKK